jgi:HTH-type transcriptional regulator/antitoxin HigA
MKAKLNPNKNSKFARLEAVPKTYRALCDLLLPRPLHDATACEEATALLDSLAVFSDLNEEQLDYLDALSHFIKEYESEARTPKFTGVELLKSLVEENNLAAADISRILDGSRTLGAMILRGERNITAGHARALGVHFRLSPAAFL